MYVLIWLTSTVIENRTKDSTDITCLQICAAKSVVYGCIKNELVSDYNPVVLRYSHCNDDADDVDEDIPYGYYG